MSNEPYEGQLRVVKYVTTADGCFWSRKKITYTEAWWQQYHDGKWINVPQHFEERLSIK